MSTDGHWLSYLCIRYRRIGNPDTLKRQKTTSVRYVRLTYDHSFKLILHSVKQNTATVMTVKKPKAPRFVIIWWTLYNNQERKMGNSYRVSLSRCLQYVIIISSVNSCTINTKYQLHFQQNLLKNLRYKLTRIPYQHKRSLLLGIWF